jgi:hypothetical protein
VANQCGLQNKKNKKGGCQEGRFFFQILIKQKAMV